MTYFKSLPLHAIAAATLLAGASAALAQAPAAPAATSAATPTYADLATLADAAPLVIRAQIRRQTTLEPARAPGLAQGFARLYVEAQTVALIAGRAGVPGAFAYLVDVPLDAKGKVPKLTKREVVLFAKPVAGRAGDVQLVSPAGQLAYTPELEARLRPILTELYAPEVPPRITGVSEALAVPGTLTGESETQIFLATENRSPVSITVLRRPWERPQWGVSWGEIIDSAAVPPARDTLRWYRLACSLPAQLPSSANLSRDPAERRLAAGDYAVVREALGPCERRITAS
ncbi:MAG: hypothetical protein ACKO01_06920 [Erythrobacter sp.]